MGFRGGKCSIRPTTIRYDRVRGFTGDGRETYEFFVTVLFFSILRFGVCVFSRALGRESRGKIE